MKRCWCGSEDFSEYSEHYYVCNNCHTLVTKEDISYDPDDIKDEKDFYGKDYWEVKMTDAASTKNLNEMVDLYLKERAVYWLKSLYRYCLPGEGNIAEVGCGLGQFSYLLKESGFQQIAYEISPEVCAYIRKELHINIECGSFKQNPGAYDVVAAFDLLEHLTEPNDFLASVSVSLKKNGIILMQMPCYDKSLTYEQMLQEKPRFKEQLKGNEHVYLYSKESIQQILEQNGFKYIVFLDAIFGNDFDMFFVASREPIYENTEEQIDRAINILEHGRLLKALINTWSKAQETLNTIINHEKQINQLIEWLKESEADRESRMKQIEELTVLLKDSETDRESRMKQIENLTALLKESETDRTARFDQIEELTKWIHERDDRLSRCEKTIEEMQRCLESEQAHSHSISIQLEERKAENNDLQTQIDSLRNESVWEKISRDWKARTNHK